MTQDIDMKWVRSAFWTGTLKAGAEGPFHHGVDNRLIPALRKLPGVSGARALWPQSREDDPPAVVCQVLVEFDSRAQLERMLASPERVQMRAGVKELAAMLDGAISHIDYAVGP